MQWISEATAATFEVEVLERSETAVVLVDFWAPWCNPCRVLGPILEAAVAARQGEVWLVKVNTDKEPQLAQQFGIQGIPAVKALLQRKVVNEFVGVRDRAAVDAFLDRVCPSAEEKAMQHAEALLAEGKPEEVEEVLQPALQSHLYGDEAMLLLARAHLEQRAYEQALAVLNDIPEESLVATTVSSLRARIDLLKSAAGQDVSSYRLRVEQHPNDSEARWILAGAHYLRDEQEEALENLLALLQRDRTYRQDGARRAMLSIFDELAPDHDLVQTFRRQMQIYL
jgi:putative thioredoxin